MKLANSTSMVEVAAGSGVAPTLWGRALRSPPHSLEASVLLTDLVPNPAKWTELQEAHPGYVSFQNSSVDATNLAAALPRDNTRGIRMISLALHHLPPEIVQGLMADVVRTNSALLVSDLAPNLGGVLWNFPLTMKYIVAGVRDHGAEVLQDWWGPLVFLFMPFMGWHDATVSVLRAYSLDQLKALLQKVPGGENYQVEVFHSPGFGRWMQLPEIFHSWFHLDDPVIQFSWITPKTRSASAVE
eukprot:TRINITY_DN4801_c0_g1_i2.p2 TRINITY_DN4801_c0_g1~~TRINITY_DN4801_c0_g1_i2.p2  ORF type:complete len:243 (-),score=41.91 TRINITY_DN4801_c0_g1_i2:336-1064(-)